MILFGLFMRKEVTPERWPWVVLSDIKQCIHSESPRKGLQGLSSMISTVFIPQLICYVFGSAKEICNSPFPISVLTDFSLDVHPTPPLVEAVIHCQGDT